MSQWSLSQTLTDKLFDCPSSVAISHRYNKLFVATYDNIECWMYNCCIQVYNIKQDKEETTYSYQGRMLLRANPKDLLLVSHDNDDSLIVSCRSTNSLYRFEVSKLLENAFDDDDYSTEHVWCLEGELGFPCIMHVTEDENGEKIIFVGDSVKNRIAVISFESGTIQRSLYGQPTKETAPEGDEEQETEEQVKQEIPEITEKSSTKKTPQENEETEDPSSKYSFTQISSVSVNKKSNQYTILVSGSKTNHKIILNGLMSTEIIDTELKNCASISTFDTLKNQQILVDFTSNEFNIIDLKSGQLIFTTQEFNLDHPVHVLLDDATRTLYIVNDSTPSITILKEKAQ